MQQHWKGGEKGAAARPVGPDLAAEAQSEHQLAIDAEVYDRRLSEQDMTKDLKKRIAVVLGDRDIPDGKCNAAL